METPNQDDDFTKPKSEWDIEPESSPKSRGIGCLSMVFIYYIFGLLIWKGENWRADPIVFRAYVLAPVAWPFAVAGFVSREATFIRYLAAIVCDIVYGRLAYNFIKAKTRRVLWRSVLYLFLLFLLAFAGCWAEFCQEFEGVN